MFFLPKQEQRLPNPAPVSVQLSSPHITHPGPTISSCKQEFKSSNHQVCESQPLEHAWNTQIIPGHWKTCKQCGREADIGSVVNTKVVLLQGELRSTAPAGTRDTSPLPSQFSVHQSPGKVTKTINSGWHKSLTERIASVQNTPQDTIQLLKFLQQPSQGGRSKLQKWKEDKFYSQGPRQ